MPSHSNSPQQLRSVGTAFNAEMRGMKMSGDASWLATVDSVRSDLVHAPTMNAAELKAFLPGHNERVTRLMQMHQTMMGAMKMSVRL